jgi:hypothetical protein
MTLIAYFKYDIQMQIMFASTLNKSEKYWVEEGSKNWMILTSRHRDGEGRKGERETGGRSR